VLASGKGLVLAALAMLASEGCAWLRPAAGAPLPFAVREGRVMARVMGGGMPPAGAQSSGWCWLMEPLLRFLLESQRLPPRHGTKCCQQESAR
jgi:hypothetical protein